MAPQHAVYGPINHHQLDALAALIVTLRPGRGPGRWTKVAVLEALQIACQERTDDALLLIRAMAAGARRPGLIDPLELADPGPHWDDAVMHAAGDTRPTALCPVCHGPTHPPNVPHQPGPQDRPTPERVRQIREAAAAQPATPRPAVPSVERPNLQGELL